MTTRVPDAQSRASPTPSDVSHLSYRSKEEPLNFGTEPKVPDAQSRASPTPSDVSHLSYRSKEEPLNFGTEPKVPDAQSRASPTPSDVSHLSYRSKEEPLNFGTEPKVPDAQSRASPTPSDVSHLSYRSKEEPLNFGTEPKKARPPLHPTLDGSKGSRKLLRLKEEVKRGILEKYESEVGSLMEESNIYEYKWSSFGKKKPETYANLFNKSGEAKVRTVLTETTERIGRTLHPKRFMIDWARGKSNQDIDLIILVGFSQLNMRESESMEDLLTFLSKDFKPSELHVDECNLLIILEGLEECDLPLDFENNNKQTNMKEPASTDVLLTNLIKGNLLPEASLWILSQPTGVNKIPGKYITKRTKCEEIDAKRQLSEEVKKKLLSMYAGELKRLEVDSELFVQVENKEVIESYKNIFTDSKKNEARTVMTVGCANIGKTFHTKKFVVEWAQGKSNSSIDLVIPLCFSELNKRRRTESLDQLIGDFFKSNNLNGQRVSLTDCNIAFILDHLEKSKIHFDFQNNAHVTDLNEKAPIDQILTSLIKGAALPAARIWILTQPSGLNKIPEEHMDKVNHCRETSKRRKKLAEIMKTAYVKIRLYVDLHHPNQKNTEHILRERTSDPAREDVGKKCIDLADIFKCNKDKKLRTVLTIGEAKIGKTFLVETFVKDWAEKRSYRRSNPEEILFHFDFLKLNLLEKKNISLVDLLNHFFEETRKCVISDFTKLKLVFILDGLDAFQHRLDFDSSVNLTDVRKSASVDVLLTNLIRGDLLPSAQVWITSQPSAAQLLPDDCIDKKTEIREKPDIRSRRHLKTQLKKEYTLVFQGTDDKSDVETSALLNEIFTDLYILEGENREVVKQNEIEVIEDIRSDKRERPVQYSDIFNSFDNTPIKTALTVGVAGVGKTFASMKFLLDWAESSEGASFDYAFPLPFRELNLKRDKELSFEGVIHEFFPAMKEAEISSYKDYKVLIVLDGYDESRLDLNFSETEVCSDIRKPVPLRDLLANLIQGNLLPEAKIWITSRPAASHHIPPENINRVTEVRGFNDDLKKQYFQKRFSDKSLGEHIFSHVKRSRSLFLFCYLPVFCWITSNVVKDFVTMKHEDDMPKTLTDMYAYFLLLQCKQAKLKYKEEKEGEGSELDSIWKEKSQETIVSLGRLAFQGFKNRNALFTEEDLKECNIEITHAVTYSGIFTQTKRQGSGVFEDKFFCFVHLSIQDFMAAFYVTHAFNQRGTNLLIGQDSADSDAPEADLYKAAVDKALDKDCQNGEWDLFLRFLLGLSLESNQNLFPELLRKPEDKGTTHVETVEYIKQKIRGDIGDADRSITLFHCLNELNDHSLVGEVQKLSKKQDLETLSPAQWSALNFVLLTSDVNLDVYDLKTYQKSENVLLRMFPVVKVSKTAVLSWCNLSEESCIGLTKSVLTLAFSNLTDLDLSHNDLLDSGVEQLAEGLKNRCKLEVLRLSGCQVSPKGCCSLASALRSNPKSCLRELDLSYNHPGENGQAMLSAIVEDPNMKLEKLCVDYPGEHRLKSGLKKYDALLQFNVKTAGHRLDVDEGRRRVKTLKIVKDNFKRFKYEGQFRRTQVMCDKGITGLAYWEVDWCGTLGVAVAYETISTELCSSGGLGCNNNSWSLLCSDEKLTDENGAAVIRFQAIHDKTKVFREMPPSSKIAVFLDWEGGTITYFSVSSGELSHIHTFEATFTGPLWAGFWFRKGSVTLCDLT